MIGKKGDKSKSNLSSRVLGMDALWFMCFFSSLLSFLSTLTSASINAMTAYMAKEKQKRSSGLHLWLYLCCCFFQTSTLLFRVCHKVAFAYISTALC